MEVLTIKRTVTIPLQSDDKKILALAEIGGDLWSKDYTYQLFFEYGYEGVAEKIKEEIKKRGGNVNDFDKKISDNHRAICDKLGVNGHKPTGTAKRTGKKVKVGKARRVKR